MANILRYTLPILAAFVFVSVATTVNAGKPVKDELITLHGGPLTINEVETNVTNVSDRDIEIEIIIFAIEHPGGGFCAGSGQYCNDFNTCDELGDFCLPNLENPKEMASSKTTVLSGWSQWLPSPKRGHAMFRTEVYYEGEVGEVRGTFCDNMSANEGRCVNLE
jgi:hypothetical protein